MQHHLVPRRAVQHRCQGRSRMATPTPCGLPWVALEQQRLRYGDNEMHAAGSLDPAPGTLQQWLARTPFINLGLLPMRPLTSLNEVLNARTTDISLYRNRDRPH